jgi:hypothetical protein
MRDITIQAITEAIMDQIITQEIGEAIMEMGTGKL